MTDEEKLKELNLLKESYKNKEILSAKVEGLAKFVNNQDENIVKYGVFVSFNINQKSKLALIRPENLMKSYNEDEVRLMVGNNINIQIIKVKNRNKIYAKKYIEKKPKTKIKNSNIDRKNVTTKINDMLNNPDKYIGKEIDVKILNIAEWGAYVEDDSGVRYLLYNSGFAYGYVPVSRVKKIGDKLNVKISQINSLKKIFYVKMVEKYREEMPVQPEDFVPEQVVKGTIVTKTSTLCFVNIAPMIDALCFPIEGLEVGTDVFIQIIGVKDLGKRKTVRGKIILTKFDDELKL